MGTRDCPQNSKASNLPPHPGASCHPAPRGESFRIRSDLILFPGGDCFTPKKWGFPLCGIERVNDMYSLLADTLNISSSRCAPAGGAEWDGAITRFLCTGVTCHRPALREVEAISRMTLRSWFRP